LWARYASRTGAQAASTLEFSTYLGGKGADYASGIAVYTNTATFPLLNAVQPTYGDGATDGFVAMFSTKSWQHEIQTTP
jgi:hypothetical protein